MEKLNCNFQYTTITEQIYKKSKKDIYLYLKDFIHRKLYMLCVEIGELFRILFNLNKGMCGRISTNNEQKIDKKFINKYYQYLKLFYVIGDNVDKHFISEHIRKTQRIQFIPNNEVICVEKDFYHMEDKEFIHLIKCTKDIISFVIKELRYLIKSGKVTKRDVNDELDKPMFTSNFLKNIL